MVLSDNAVQLVWTAFGGVHLALGGGIGEKVCAVEVVDAYYLVFTWSPFESSLSGLLSGAGQAAAGLAACALKARMKLLLDTTQWISWHACWSSLFLQQANTLCGGYSLQDHAQTVHSTVAYPGGKGGRSSNTALKSGSVRCIGVCHLHCREDEGRLLPKWCVDQQAKRQQHALTPFMLPHHSCRYQSMWLLYSLQVTTPFQ